MPPRDHTPYRNRQRRNRTDKEFHQEDLVETRPIYKLKGTPDDHEQAIKTMHKGALANKLRPLMVLVKSQNIPTQTVR